MKIIRLIAAVTAASALTAAHAQEARFITLAEIQGIQLAAQSGSFERSKNDNLALLVRVITKEGITELGHFMIDGRSCDNGFGGGVFRRLNGKTWSTDWALGAGTGWAEVADAMCEMRKRVPLEN